MKDNLDDIFTNPERAYMEHILGFPQDMDIMRFTLEQEFWDFDHTKDGKKE